MSEDPLRIPEYLDHILPLRSEVPWQDIYLMRNRVAHGYFSIDLEIVWKTVKRDIPELEQQVAPLRVGLADGSVAGNGSGVAK